MCFCDFFSFFFGAHCTVKPSAPQFRRRGASIPPLTNLVANQPVAQFIRVRQSPIPIKHVRFGTAPPLLRPGLGLAVKQTICWLFQIIFHNIRSLCFSCNPQNVGYFFLFSTMRGRYVLPAPRRAGYFAHFFHKVRSERPLLFSSAEKPVGAFIVKYPICWLF